MGEAVNGQSPGWTKSLGRGDSEDMNDETSIDECLRRVDAKTCYLGQTAMGSSQHSQWKEDAMYHDEGEVQLWNKTTEFEFSLLIRVLPNSVS